MRLTFDFLTEFFFVMHGFLLFSIVFVPPFLTVVEPCISRPLAENGGGQGPNAFCVQ